MRKFRPFKTVAVLGCGPAGLLAAHAVGLAGQPLSVHSKPVKSRLGGAQFLHESIPQLTSPDPDYMIKYELRGTPIGYREKVYGLEGGTNPEFVSMENVTDQQMQGVWDLVNVYEDLWEIFGQSINEADINGEWLTEHANEFTMVISTIPRPALCMNPAHKFEVQRIWIDPTPPLHVPQNTIVYNGEPSPSWYRASRIGAYGGTEYSEHTPTPPGVERVPVQKPIRTNCDCWPNVFHVGRYGAWTKGLLVHHAYEAALRAAASLR